MSWEKPKISLVLGILSTGQTSMEWAMNFAQLHSQLSATRRFYLSYSRGAPWDIARNHCVDDTLKLGAEWLFFLDTDVIAPTDVVERLIARNLPIVSALYYRRHKPIHACMWRVSPTEATCSTCGQRYSPFEKGKYNPLADYPRGELIECDAVGMGACLIHRKVLEKVHHPPDDPLFVWSAGREGVLSERVKNHVLGVKGTSEDFYACEKIKAAGFKIFCDTNIICPHYGDVKFVPPEKMNVDEIKFGGLEFPHL